MAEPTDKPSTDVSCPCITKLTFLEVDANPRVTKTEESGTIVVELNRLVTVLLEPNFDAEEAARLKEVLADLGCKPAEIQTRFLSCLAFHEAWTFIQQPRVWRECIKKWVTVCGNFGISEWVMGQAISAGQTIRAALHDQPKKAVETAIYNIFFVGSGVIKELTEQPPS